MNQPKEHTSFRPQVIIITMLVLVFILALANLVLGSLHIPIKEVLYEIFGRESKN